MLIKNSKKLFIFFVFSLFIFNINLYAEEFNITAKEIVIDKDKEILIGKGSVEAIDSEGKIVNADKITYEKSREFLLAEKDVKISDEEGNIFISDKATYDKINELIITYDNTEITLKEGYKLSSKNVTYNTESKILSSNDQSIFNDKDGNVIETNMFQYNIKENLFSAIGDIKIKDINNNKYFFKELYVDTKNMAIVGSEVSVVLDQENFGLNENYDPRFVANDIFVSRRKINLSKGIFTVCKKRDNNKCPPWALQAKKITHDRVKKTIYYEHATLKVYDIPVFYFPKFFHPDPTVKRQSGFLSPLFTTSTTVGTGFGLPYFWALSNDKDITFTPKFYAKENVLFLNEYRQAFRNGFLTLDTSFTEGYSDTTEKKTSGSRNHIFANIDFNLSKDDSYESNLSFKVQKTSNDTFFRVHDINTELVNSENTTLENEIKYNFTKNNMYLNINASIYENLRQAKKHDKYEYILPNIMYGKTFFTDNFGTIDFKSNAVHTNYETNVYETFLNNDIIWNSPSNITKNGFVNSLVGMIRNSNYKTSNTPDIRDEGEINELNGVLAYKTSLPMKKDGVNFSNLFSPNIMFRYAPGHLRDLSDKDFDLSYNNLYSLNKTSEIDSGLSAILGFDFKINEKSGSRIGRERLSLSLGQIVSYEENNDMPSKSSMDQKTSDIVGEFNYNFSEIGRVDYKFAMDHNLNDLNYNEISTKLDFGKVTFNLDYLEKQNHIGSEHYASSGVTLNFNKNNRFSFSTKKNFKTESTELYDLGYQYELDCLTAGLVYRREFYRDVDDVEPKDTFMFTISFVPFTTLDAPISTK